MFFLKKWYLDCVTGDGEAVILYWALVNWGPLNFRYGAALHLSPSGDRWDRQTFRPGAEPASNDGIVALSWPRLGASGTWSSRLDGIEATLLEDPRGRIQWSCVGPSADVDVTIDGGRLEGLGYAEHLTSSIKPWRLPFRELRWGRFVSESDSLVWIQWRGHAPASWVWLNGEARPGDVRQDRVHLADDGGSLELCDARIVRSGFLNRTTSRGLRPLSALVPGWRSAHETKWLARGTLRQGRRARSSGWVVHEVVTWP